MRPCQFRLGFAIKGSKRNKSSCYQISLPLYSFSKTRDKRDYLQDSGLTMTLPSNLEFVICNLCGNDTYRVLFPSTLTEEDIKYGHAHYLISQKSPVCGRIVQCRQCGLVYVNPRERASDILLNYAMVQDTAYLLEQEARSATFHRGLRLLERYCPRKGNLLDVGCFVGLFLDIARGQGWSVSGIEPSRWAVEYAREKLNIEVLWGSLVDSKLGPDIFDAITMWDVVEHLSDPKAALLALHGKLRENGVLLLNTVNYNSVFRRIFGRKYWFIERMHIYYFTPETLKKMLEACNYRVVKILPHFKTLSLEYLSARLSDSRRLLSSAMKAIGSLFFLEQRHVTVYTGQMTVIAKKKDNGRPKTYEQPVFSWLR